MDYATVISLCRLCATQNIDSNSVENLSLADNPDRKILLLLVNKYLRITVSDCDSLPPKFCSECIQKLHSFDTFSRRCHEVQEMFSSISDSPFMIGLDFNESVTYDTLPTPQVSKHPNAGDWTDLENIKDEDECNKGDYNSSPTCQEVKVVVEADSERSLMIVPPLRIKTVRQKKIAILSNDKAIDESSRTRYEIRDSKLNGGTLVKENSRGRSKSRTIETENYDDEAKGDFLDSPSFRNYEVKEKKTSKKNPFAIFEFSCHVCQEVFKNFSILKRHCSKEHDESAFVNCVCGKQLRARTAIIEHRRKHTGTSLFKCDTCGKTFNRRSLMCLHMISHMPKDEQPYVCCKCAKRFHTSSLLKKHEKVHLPEEERFLDVCNLCQKKFTSKSAVNAHLRAVHYGEKPFVCEHCGNSFSSKAILTDHLTTHSEYAPWPCEVCGRNFKSKYRLNVHMDMHRSVKYRCPHCPMELSTRRTLRMHLLVHKEEKAYVCKVCSKAFRRSKDLKNHNNLHTGRRPYKCEFCERTFANGSNCRAHKLRMHPVELGVEKNSRSYSCKQKNVALSNTDSTLTNVDSNITVVSADNTLSMNASQNLSEQNELPEASKNSTLVDYSKYDTKYEFPSTTHDLDYSLDYARYTAPLNLNLKRQSFIQQPNMNQLTSFSNDMHTDISKMHFLYS